MSVNIRNYAMVTAAYWGLTVTDGALRMLVLLHFYTLGYSEFDIALLFLLYEFFGVLTNLVGGWIASRLGLTVTLYAGLALQIVALGILSLFNPAWPLAAGVAYVMGAQALSGVAKDLTKMSSKSAVKVLVPDGEHGALFKWVAVLTGSKNALKGVGFFVGGVLLTALGFTGALWAMAAGLAVVLVGSALMISGDLGEIKTKTKFRHIFSKSRDMNYLSAARMFLFGSRDVWFVVGLPVFLEAAQGWGHMEVGAYMATWVIAYGFVQAVAPRVLRSSSRTPGGAMSRFWITLLVVVTAGIAAAVHLDFHPGLSVLIGLGIFGFIFAVNSALHSYLILAYTKAEDVALDVGFYYMANAWGRLIGTLMSGLAYQWGGLVACMVVSAAFLVLSWGLSFGLSELDAKRPGQPHDPMTTPTGN